MLISAESNELIYDAKIVEPVINREASTYIENNYFNLLRLSRSLGIDNEKAEDLLHDIYVSIYTAEDNGDGFDMQYGVNLDDNKVALMSVEQYVVSKLQKYAKNSKYSKEYSEVRGSGNDGIVVVVAESNNDESDKTLNEFQAAYKNAPTVDSIEDVDEGQSMREQIEFCIDICDKYNVNLRNLLRNVDLLSDFVKTLRQRSKEPIFGVFDKIIEENDEFPKTLVSILNFSRKHRVEFGTLIESMG